MPQVIWALLALEDLQRLRMFLRPKSPEAARRAAEAINDAVQGFREHPNMGRPVPELPGCRELLVDFGTSGYIALYRHMADQVTVLALRHQREAGYRLHPL